jgi:hypothetical protein
MAGINVLAEEALPKTVSLGCSSVLCVLNAVNVVANASLTSYAALAKCAAELARNSGRPLCYIFDLLDLKPFFLTFQCTISRVCYNLIDTVSSDLSLLKNYVSCWIRYGGAPRTEDQAKLRTWVLDKSSNRAGSERQRCHKSKSFHRLRKLQRILLSRITAHRLRHKFRL